MPDVLGLSPRVQNHNEVSQETGVIVLFHESFELEEGDSFGTVE